MGNNGQTRATMELEERTRGTSRAMVDGPSMETPHESTTIPASGRHAVTTSSYLGKLKHWWTQNISLVLEDGPNGGDPRDYFALERTYLAWFRTSVAITSFGIVITQLFILRNLDPIKGKVLGAILAFGGVVSNLLGCIRYFSQQSLLLQGKALCGGWHTTVILVLLTMILLTLFVIVLVES